VGIKRTANGMLVETKSAAASVEIGAGRTSTRRPPKRRRTARERRRRIAQLEAGAVELP
jgi:hypothetical protein